MNLSFASQLYFPQISERSQKLFLSKLFIFAFIFEVLNNCIILADNKQKLSDHETPNLKVFQQKNTPDNFNIGVIHVKLKNWTTTRFPRISNKFHFILNETDNLEQLNKRRRNNNEVGESRGRRTEGSQPNRGNNEGSSNGRMEMDAIFPYLLLALGLALVVFFVILYAILNALLQRKDQHDSERRRKRKKRKRRRGRRGWRNDNNLIDREKQFEDDEENSSEEKHLDSIEEEGSNNLSRPVARWHRSRDGQLSPLEVDDENESDWMMTGGGGIRRYRQYKTTGSGRRVPPPLPQLPPPVHEIIPPRSRQLSQQHYPQHYARGQRHIGWANEDQISLPGILRSTPVIPPPPPPRVPPPPPPLPARYQRRRRRPPGEPSIENSSDENDDQSSDGGNRRNRVYNKRQQDENKRNNPPHPIKRENTDSTISSLHRGGSL